MQLRKGDKHKLIKKIKVVGEMLVMVALKTHLFLMRVLCTDTMSVLDRKEEKALSPDELRSDQT